jgi:hypothetical protein
MFIRSKFLFLGMVASLEEKNEYTFYSLAKSYWENVAALGFYYLKIERLLNEGNEETAFQLAAKMGLGGRGFPTPEMIANTGRNQEDYTLPNIYTMMDKVDEDFKKRAKIDGAVLRDLYDVQVAEGGHTTFTGLTIAAKWTNDRSAQIPDIRRKWDSRDKASLLNMTNLSTLIFFYYWGKFEEL